MYRIRLATGREHTYASIQELTAGVQSGEVTAEAQIYHQRTDRWLGIDTHPHYRMVVDGTTATRSNRLRFTRPSQPVATPVVRPTPAAHTPEKGDLEELNRLLVLLDPLPTPAQHADPPVPEVQSPPSLSLVRPDPEPAAPPADPADFGTMLRLEDLESLPPVPPAPAPALELLRDERVMQPEPAAVPEPAPVAPAAELPPAPSDLGLPVEVRLDELPTPEFLEPPAPLEALSADLAVVEPSLIEMPAQPAEEPALAAPVAEALPEPLQAQVAEPVSLSTVQVEPGVIEIVATDAVPAFGARRRARPMLYVATAAILALVIFAFTSRGESPNQGMVTPASATAPSIPATQTGVPAQGQAQPAAQPIGFPLPTAEQAKAAQAQAQAERQAAEQTTPAAPVVPSAPAIDLGASGTEVVSAGESGPRTGTGGGAALARSYASAYATLRSEFEAQMDRTGLVRLFGQTQLTTADGIAGARRALDAAADAVRQYRTGEGIIERAYQDSARALERSGASAADLRDWITRVSLKESQEAAGEGARLIGQIDAVFALLQGQFGRYRVEGSTIRFDDRNAAARYTDLQAWINRRLEHWSGQPVSSVPTSVQPILEGIGLTRLPSSR